MSTAAFRSGILESNENPTPVPVLTFIFKVDTTLAGGSANDTFFMPLTNGEAYNITIDWGDGNSDVINSSATSGMSHTYTTAGEYDITISGTAPELIFGGSTDVTKITAIKNWGNNTWSNFENMFEGATNLSGYSAIDPPTIGTATSMRNMFKDNSSLVANLSNWNTTGITDMSGMFEGASLFTSDLSSWDVSAVTTMASMFKQADSFNGDIETWVLTALQDMSSMFEGADVFNRDISTWTTTTALTNMAAAFKDAPLFDRDISSWETSNVTDMSELFRNAVSYDTVLSSLDTSSLSNADYMLANINTTSSNLGVNNWDVTSLTTAIGFMEDHDMNTATYNNILNGWGVQSVQSNVTVDFGTSRYDGLALINRDDLVDNHSWTILDGGIVIQTMIAGGNASENGYLRGEFGNLSPRDIGPYDIDGLFFDNDIAVTCFPFSYDNALVFDTNGAGSTGYWSDIRIWEGASSDPSNDPPTWTFFGSGGSDTCTLTYTGGPFGDAARVAKGDGVGGSGTSIRFTPGETYYIVIVN